MQTLAEMPLEAPIIPIPLQQWLEDMELISYAASHDLLAPVRVIATCSDILKERSSQAETTELVKTISAETVRLRDMLNGLQEYVRIESFPVKYEAVDGNEIINDAIAALYEEIRAAGATVTHDPLPYVMGHKGRLTRLFGYLIDNALKFRGHLPPAVLVSARLDEEHWQFCVADNGIGIEETYYDIIFRLFQRLHSEEAYGGYGIGLALSQKIVATHGGRLWVESAPGQGSRFYFTLPAVQP